MNLGLSMLAIFPLAMAATGPTTDMKQVLDALKAQDSKPIETLTPEQARLQKGPSDAVKSVMTKKDGIFKPIELSKIEDREIDGAAGKISARIYTPEGKTPLPVIVYYHGGGFVIATNDTYDSSARALAKNANAIVVAPEYRKAPEHKFPAAHDDAFATYKWVLLNAQNIGGDPQRIAVAGESAGGNLALNTAIRARDEGLSIPTHELLIYPVASTSMDSASYKEHANAQPLSKKNMTWFVENYTNGTTDLKDKRLNLVEANFKGLRPATIITADIDPLRDEGKLLAERMRGQGVDVEYRNYDGVTHEFFGMAPLIQEAAAAQNFAVTDLKESFEKQAQEDSAE
jgi:acetyl esterase